MGISKVPSGGASHDERLLPALMKFELWQVKEYPLNCLNGKLDKDVSERPWLFGLMEDLEQAGKFRNPVVVWNHHPNRLTGKQPGWLLRAGSNRVWCAEQLGWTHVPAIVSTVDPADEQKVRSLGGTRIVTADLQNYFPDGGVIWGNQYGWGLLRAKKPEDTYAGYAPTGAQIGAIKPTAHGITKILNPLDD